MNLCITILDGPGTPILEVLCSFPGLYLQLQRVFLSLQTLKYTNSFNDSWLVSRGRNPIDSSLNFSKEFMGIFTLQPSAEYTGLGPFESLPTGSDGFLFPSKDIGRWHRLSIFYFNECYFHLLYRAVPRKTSDEMKRHRPPFSLTGSKVPCRWQMRLGFPLIGKKKLSLLPFRLSLTSLAPAEGLWISPLLYVSLLLLML